MSRRVLAALALAVGVWTCADPTGAEPDPPHIGDEATVLFIGNSLTFTEDVPGLVQALADAAGRSFEHETIAQPSASLELHFQGPVPDRIRALEPDMVVLQQGSSALPEGREHLLYWTRQFAEVIRDAGGEPALYMVWPPRDYAEYFPEVWTSYRMAADTVRGLFIPAGQTWAEALAIDPSLELYMVDGSHQTYLDAIAAAETIYASLYGVPADSVPVLDDGISPETRAVLRTALARSLAKAGYRW